MVHTRRALFHSFLIAQTPVQRHANAKSATKKVLSTGPIIPYVMKCEEAPETAERAETAPALGYTAITCQRCGKEVIPLHLGCRFCEECCDCRPAGS